MDNRAAVVVDHLLADLADDARPVWRDLISRPDPHFDHMRLHDGLHARIGALTRSYRRSRSGLPIHAAQCTLPDGRGVTILGPTGSGKSTLAILLGCDLGATLVSDDTIWLRADGVESLGVPVSIRSRSPFRDTAAQLWYADESERLLARADDLGVPGVRRFGTVDMIVVPRFAPTDGLRSVSMLSSAEVFCHLATSLLRSASHAEINFVAQVAATVPAAVIHFADAAASTELCREFFQAPAIHKDVGVVRLSAEDRTQAGLCRDVEGLVFGHEAALWRPPSDQLVLVKQWTNESLRNTAAGDQLATLGFLVEG